MDDAPPGGVERLWPARLRWRLRGAWQWPLFFPLTLIGGALLHLLPAYGEGPGGVVPGFLLVGFANLFCVAVLAPVAGRRVRRRRPDLPQAIATNYAGAALVCLVFAAVVAGGLAHHGAVVAEDERRARVAGTLGDFVRTQEPSYAAGLGAADALKIDDDLYRACVPGHAARRALCVFVSTDQQPPGVRRDTDMVPNDVYRRQGFG